MHEVGITQSIVEIAEKHAREQGAARINTITVEIGALSGVVPEAVEFCFEAVSRATMLADARLVIERLPGRGRCRECGAETAIDRFTFVCPTCDAMALETVQGEELRIKEMEVD